VVGEGLATVKLPRRRFLHLIAGAVALPASDATNAATPLGRVRERAKSEPLASDRSAAPHGSDCGAGRSGGARSTLPLTRPSPTLYRRACHRPRGFVPPCLPPQPPAGEAWLHEIKHDGFRVIARKDGARVRLYSRPGNDLLPLWIAPGVSPAIDIRVGVGQLPRRTAWHPGARLCPNLKMRTS
jgi:hypothetical protein